MTDENTKAKAKKRLNQLFSIFGLLVGGGVILYLVFYIRNHVDLTQVLTSIQPLWIIGAALCIPALECIDALIFYSMGRRSGQPVTLSGCFDCTFIGELYYRLGAAGAPVQIKLMLDAGFSGTATATVYTWKAVSNTVVYGFYAVTALICKSTLYHTDLGWAIIPTILLISLYVLICGAVFFIAARPQRAATLGQTIICSLSRHVKYLAREGRAQRLIDKVNEFCTQVEQIRGNYPLLLRMFGGMFLELTLLYSIPWFLYRGLGLSGISFAELVLTQCLVMVLSRIVVLPGNAGGAEASFYLFMLPLFGGNLLAVAMVLWRLIAFVEVMLLGGVYSTVRFAYRSVKRQ